jgi:hypothetical protein
MLFKKKSGENRYFEAENGDLGEKPVVFSNGEKRRKDGRRSPETAFCAFSAGKIPQTENRLKFRISRRLLKIKQPANG